MEPFAAVEDLEKHWRPLSAEEKETAKTKLLYASAVVANEGERDGIDFSSVEDGAAIILTAVVCDMAKRAMTSSADQSSVSQMAESAGPFSTSYTFANPSGDVYLTRSEERRLGLGGQRLGSIVPCIGGADDEG